ncbi:hypothetical protein [Pseudopedobacter beijingensis]|uniref:Outer membrane porin, OprD family n=1 Tax=Pseudopedobacter beijingensis TaxID=1207056 RepID=A0ABW4IDV8_9SPHI
MKRLVVMLVVFSLSQSTMAQENHIKDTIENKSLVSYLKEGEISGHIRNYFLMTENQYGNDYYANAIGGVLSYETKSYKGFQLGVSGIFTYKLFSSDLNKTYDQTNKSSRWEQELFDVNHKDNFKDLDRLEELYIKYHWKNSYITYGKIPVEYTPLLNKSDGRMKPFAFQGAWLHHKNEKIQADAAWIHRVSPRSMTEWFSMEEVIGLTDNGYLSNGEKADYEGTTHSQGLAIVHLGKEFKNLNANFWNFHLDKFINTSWLQLEYSKQDFLIGMIYSFQIPNSYQKKLSEEKRYVQPNENGQVASFMLKYINGHSQIKAAYSKAFETGRYLFPKELGRDQFYTSMPRSRIEGLGGVDVFAIGYQYNWKHFFLNIDATTTYGAEIENYELNKYNIDDYYQINTRLHYEFSNFLKGLHVELLYVWKQNKNEHNPKLVVQRSDYNQINLITNFNF